MSIVAKRPDGSRCNLVWRYKRDRTRCVRWGPSSPERAQTPNFRPMSCCGQMAGWIKIPLDTDVGFGPCDIVLDEDPAQSRKGAQQLPIFGPCLLSPNVWMNQDATMYGSRPRHRPHCVRWPLKGAQQPSLFGPCLLWPNGRPSQQLLSCCCTAHDRTSLYVSTIRWTILTCAQKLTSSQLNLPHGTKQKRIVKKVKTNKSSAVAEMGDRGHNSVGCHSSA